MELIAIIIIGSLALIIFAFVYNSKAKARKQQQILATLIAEAAKAQGLSWDQSDTGMHRAMAWSATHRLLAFAQFIDAKEHLSVISMQETSDCRLLETGHKEAGSGAHNITGVELKFSFKDQSREAVSLPFYSERHDGLYDKLILTQKARHWKELISA